MTTHTASHPVSHQVRLTRRPSVDPSRDDFTVARVPVPPLADGQVLVRNTHLALGAVMRGLILGSAAPLPAYPVGDALFGPAVGRVVDSTVPDLRAGQWVRHRSGWRDLAWGPAAGFAPLDTATLPDPVAHLLPGPVADVGMRAAAGVRAGDTVLVTGAAGSVGSLAGQVARLLGASRVIGTAGGADKAAWAETVLGYDRVLDHRVSDLGVSLAAEVPDGLDAVFDTVGGTQLETAVALTRPRARIALCGSLASQFGDGDRGLHLDPSVVIGSRLTLAGFVPADHPELVAAWPDRLATWLAEGRFHLPVHRAEAVGDEPLQAAVDGILDLFAGRTRGTVVVYLDDAHR